MLESLAYSNYASPHPRPIDPAVFFDLVKIRRLVEDATDLAVRAANGTTSSTLSNSLNAGNGIFGGVGAAALGLGVSGGGANAKLSRERKHRMRELATQKLSRAYHLDEIAASVATMQSASSLEEVAKLVLQRRSHDPDAKYVHFFHEKIPSRMLAQCTNLDPLDEIVQDRPTDGAPLRTRAVTKMFKDDFLGAARDLTDGLTICRYMTAQHRLGIRDLERDAFGGLERKSAVGGDYSYESKLGEEDQPISLESQLLFHRAGVYLTLACQNVHASLDDSTPSADVLQDPTISHAESDPPSTPIAKEIHGRQLEARKMVKTNAKRALRDYISFLSNFKYTPGLSTELTAEGFHVVNAAANENPSPKEMLTDRLLEMPGKSSLDRGNPADPLVPHKDDYPHHQDNRTSHGGLSNSTVSAPAVYPVSTLFSPSPPPNLPLFPGPLALVSRKVSPQNELADKVANQLWTQKEPHEAVTYHPLLTDALHSLLLCHCLIQTSSKEHLRHAHMVARLARICDGYPIFLAARSPSRSDWIEVLRLANNWIELQQSWESLCAPAPLSAHAGVVKEETEEEAKDSLKQEAIMEALADERVCDEASFQAAVAARERRAEAQRRDELDTGGSIPGRWVQEDEREYPISTERAETVARWVREAPRAVEGSGKAKRGANKGKGRKDTKRSSSPGESRNSQITMKPK